MDLIEETRHYVTNILADEPSSHDMSHITRVENISISINEKEGGNLEVIRLAALLHDVGIIKEYKIGGDHAIYSAEIAQDFLNKKGVNTDIVAHVVSCIQSHRFSRGVKATSLEAQILQDADRIDALGAVGIFRSLVSMGSLRTLKSTIGTVKETSMNAYAADPIDGFYDYMQSKPLKIIQKLNTQTAKIIARERLNIMQIYLDTLKKETSFNK